MQYDLNTFTSRAEARAWLTEGGYGPCHNPFTLGLWANGTHTVQAFANSRGGWTIKKYVAPNPDHYITD